MSEKQTFSFQTEVKQLLHLLIHSLYSHREIFLREMISNSSDALEKLRFRMLSNPEDGIDSSKFNIFVDVNEKNKTISISDNGIGMSRDDIIKNLGTIARSGTKNFIDKLTGDKVKDSQLIGKFGIGFYSAFLIAEEVTVNSLKFGCEPGNAVCWQSNADGEFTITPGKKDTPGTEVILHLKDSAKEFLNMWKVKQLIMKYSDHIDFPIQMFECKTDKEGKDIVLSEKDTINKAISLWLRDKSEINEKEYNEFYKHLSNDVNSPLEYSHSKVEGKVDYTMLLYIPDNAPFDLWDRERKSGLQLYINRVFIMENFSLLPSYLRFVKGIVDSSDLPLNVSREILQDNEIVHKIKKTITKKILDSLEKMIKTDPEKYLKFWNIFGKVLKEGPAEDYDNKDRIASLLRFSSTHDNVNNGKISLTDYVSRMKDKQKHIYYLTAESFNAAKSNPQLEIFRKNNIEVLLLSDRVDEWMTSHLSSFKSKNLKSIAKGDLDLKDLINEEKNDTEEQKSTDKKYENMLKQMKNILKNKVEDVRISKRLTESPSCIVVGEYGMSMHLQKLMLESGQMTNMPGAPSAKPVLEININHKFVENLNSEQDDAKFTDWTGILYQQAMLIEGARLEDPSEFISLVNKYLS